MMHRAYHALPPLHAPSGDIVNAVYGFLSMLLKVIEDIKPTHIIVCFDRPSPTFRKTLYAGYQAQRPKMKDDLSGQMVLLHQVLVTIQVTIYELDGYEADDLIGTLSRQAYESGGIKTHIVTGDRDLLQLVNDRTTVLSPIMGITKMTEYTTEKVKEKFGIMPSQIVDYKALVGDQSDGYPGITGIGPKTAASLLQKFETFENLYHNLGEIPPKMGEKLALDAEQGALAKQLATIITDAPIHLDSQKAQIAHMTKETLYDVCADFGFHSLRKRIAQMSSISDKTTDNKQLGLL